MFLKPAGLHVVLVGTIGLAFVLILNLWDLYGDVVEQRHRHEVLANGKEAMALALKSSGLQSVILSWTDFDGRPRTGEARTRKQVSSDGRFVGKRVAIKFLVDAPSEPIILSEVDDRETENNFWIESDIWVTSLILAVFAIIGFQVLKHGVPWQPRRAARGERKSRINKNRR
jgi:hypothetical protein